MTVQPGDKIRILEDHLQAAAVQAGDILTVTRLIGSHVIAARPPGGILPWWFSVDREGTGFEKVEG